MKTEGQREGDIALLCISSFYLSVSPSLCRTHMADYDVIIIGGGPAGMSALIWCHSLGLRGVLIEQSTELGGQTLEMFHRVLDYPGLIAENGRELRDHFAAHLDFLQLDYRLGQKIEEIDPGLRRARCDGKWAQGRAIIIATGARKRRLGVPG